VQICAIQIKPSTTTQQWRVNKTHNGTIEGWRISLATHYNTHKYPCLQLPALASVCFQTRTSKTQFYLLQWHKRTVNVKHVNELHSFGWRLPNFEMWHPGKKCPVFQINLLSTTSGFFATEVEEEGSSERLVFIYHTIWYHIPKIEIYVVTVVVTSNTLILDAF
jgi:hypothetical protein